MHVYPHEKPELKLRTAQRYEAESKTAEQAALDKFESSNSGRKPIISVGAEKLNTFHGQQPVKVLPDEIVEVRVGGPVPRVPLLYPGISVRYVGSISASQPEVFPSDKTGASLFVFLLAGAWFIYVTIKQWFFPDDQK